MKKILSLLAVVALLAGCYSELNLIVNDPNILHELEYSVLTSNMRPGQGLCKVGDYYIIGDQSSDSWDSPASTSGYIYIYDSSFALVGTIRHTLGHMGGMSYDTDMDVILTGNGNVGVSPRVDILLNVREAIENAIDGQTVTYDYDGNNVIHIPLKTNSKELLFNGEGGCWCFAGNNRTAIISIRHSVTHFRSFFIATLGLGTNDLSSDENGWGSFISGKSNAEYNGTIKIEKTYNGSDITSAQGMFYNDGELVIASSTVQVLLNQVQFTGDSYVVKRKSIASFYDANNGERLATEPEDIERVGYNHFICSTTRGLIDFYF